MANEMIERVARAIYEVVNRRSSGDYDIDGEIAQESARAAIAAMRKPTGAMLRAGDLPAHEENTLEVWQEMIDAALSNEG